MESILIGSTQLQEEEFQMTSSISCLQRNVHILKCQLQQLYFCLLSTTLYRFAFTQLTKELHTAFKPKGWLLSAAVPAPQYIVQQGYEVGEISKYLDFINIMTYDMHGTWDGYADNHAKFSDTVSCGVQSNQQ